MEKIIISFLLFFTLKSNAQAVKMWHINNYTSITAPQVIGEDSSIIAFSVRLLNTTYTGNCIKVRRSSDNTEQNIGFVSGNLDTVSLKSFVGANSGYVSIWYDQSSLGNNAIQTTNSKQPRIINAGVVDRENTKPCFVFNGANSLDIAARPFTGITALSMLYVANYKNAESYEMLITQTNANAPDRILEIRRANLANSQQILINITSFTDTVAINNIRILNSLYTNNIVGTFYINGTLKSSSVPGASFGSHVCTIGARHNSTFFFAGNMQEIIAYKKNKVSVRTTLELNVNTYYSIY